MIKTIKLLQILYPIYQAMYKSVHEKDQRPKRTRYGRQQAKGERPASRQPQFFAGFLPPAVANHVSGACQVLIPKHLPIPLAKPGEKLFVGPESSL
jgi:hypothetical protein